MRKTSDYGSDEITEVVAIDGPAGTGKSSVAKRVADALGYAYLDTGAMYRAATWWALHEKIDLDDCEAAAAVVARMALKMHAVDGCLKVLVGEEDVSAAIRSPEVTRVIYKLDQNAEVRAQLVAWQRAFGAEQPTVAEGRDMGTVVFPKAKCKVFLDASLDERTGRRARELRASGRSVDEAVLREEIAERDRKSRERKVSPLRRAEDAVLVDTTAMTLDEVVDRIVCLAREAFSRV